MCLPISVETGRLKSVQHYKHSLSITSQLPFCSVPLRLDTYNECQFSCSFCFAKTRGGNVGASPRQQLSLEALKSRFERVATGTIASALDEMLERRIPIQLGGMTDPFSPWEKRLRVSLAALRVLHKHNYPTLISTKGTMVVDDCYLSILRDGNFLVRVSITGIRPSLAQTVERGVPICSARLKIVEALSNAGVPVSVRLQPIFPGEERFLGSLIDQIAEAGARHVSAEYLKWPVEEQASLAIKLDRQSPISKTSFLNLGALRVGREYVLPVSYKLNKLLELKHHAQKRGLVFGFAENELLHLNEFHSCCNAADLFLSGASFFSANILTAVKRAIVGQRIFFGSLSQEWRPTHSLLPYLNSRSRKGSGAFQEKSWIALLQRKWNSGTWRGGPSSFYGIEKTDSVDSHGNAIYRRCY